MKKAMSLVIALLIALGISGCSQKEAPVQPRDGVDLDLTELSSTMVYSEVYNMMQTPEKYLGKTIKMAGNFAVYQDTANNKNYYACLIADATACCQQGIEFEWKGTHRFPEDYPSVNAEISVVGTFETYEEGGYCYCRLKDAELTF